MEGEPMRKVGRTLVIALLFAGSAALTASAQTSRGAGDINSAAQNFTPIERAACRGWGTLLPAGIHPSLRPIPMLVPSLLISARDGAAQSAASSLS
jgi:predicted small secreted protein